MPNPKLSPCLCGSEDVSVGPSAHRAKAREATGTHFEEVSKQDLRRGDVQRDYYRTELAMNVLKADHAEVSCDNCGRWVHGTDEQAAAVLWNKAIDKLAHLQACCTHDYERRVDYDGQVMHVCTSPDHDDTVHGRRYFPLEPAEGYDVTPSDAEDQPKRGRK